MKGGVSRLEERTGRMGTAVLVKVTLEVQKAMVEDVGLSEKKDCLVRRKVLGIWYRHEEWRGALVPAPKKRERVRKVKKERGGRRLRWWDAVCLGGREEKRSVLEN